MKIKRATANLRISYIGGGYDFPQFFEHRTVTILSEGLPLAVRCTLTEKLAEWRYPENLGSGLGSSAARYLSFVRARFPQAPFREQVEAVIALDGLQAGGWQDPIASAYEGIIVIVLHKNDWSVYPLRDLALVLHPYRRLYEIPVEREERNILVNMWCRESTCDEMQALTRSGIVALKEGNIAEFGKTVRQAWEIKKQWHPEISNPTIVEMEKTAKAANAWGWKCCGAGGQGYMLVIGDEKCHQQMRKQYTIFQVNDEA